MAVSPTGLTRSAALLRFLVISGREHGQPAASFSVFLTAVSSYHTNNSLINLTFSTTISEKKKPAYS
jgi:hypothetical protein